MQSSAKCSQFVMPDNLCESSIIKELRAIKLGR